MAQLLNTTIDGDLEVTGTTNLLSKVTSDTRQNINYIGRDPILNTDEDTTENWIDFGSGYAYFGSSILQSQPASYGFLENIVCGTNIHQVFTSWQSGTVNRKWVRTGNLDNPLDGDWVQFINENYPQYIKIYKTSDTTNYSTTNNYFDPLYAGVTTALVRGSNLEAGTCVIGTYGDRTDYTVRGIYIGANIRTIRVSYSVRLLNNSESRTVLSISPYRLRNGTSALLQNSRLTHDYGAVSLVGSTITTVQEGDFIYLMGYKGVASLDIDVIGGNATQMVVELIR